MWYYPNYGSWRLNERARLMSHWGAREYGEFLTCTAPGTFGKLPDNATVTCTQGDVFIDVANCTLQTGDVVQLPGGTARLTVFQQVGPNRYQLTGGTDVAASGGKLVYVAPVFESLAARPALQTDPVLKAKLPAPGTIHPGLMATIQDPAPGKSNLVFYDGVVWKYMDGAQV